MYDHILHRGRKSLCCRCLQAFSTEEILKHHIKDCFKTNGKQGIEGLKKVNMLKSWKNFKKSPFIIFADFESIIEDKGK